MRAVDPRPAWRLLPVSVMAVIVASLVLAPAKAGAWGAIAPASTHQWIDEQAMALLTKDPAFSAALFPAKAQIDAHEGVNWSGTPDAWFDYMVGPGPDSDGASPYSWHYYNPELSGANKGGGPTASSSQFAALLAAEQKGDADAAGKIPYAIRAHGRQGFRQVRA